MWTEYETVAGLAAKPILDVAIGLAPGTDPKRAVTALQPLGCRFRGDKGGDGSLLLVLENRPAHRVAHLHLVGHGDVQWRRYLALRDRLRADSAARAAYAQLKGRLAVQFSGDVAPTPPPRRPSSSNCCRRTSRL